MWRYHLLRISVTSYSHGTDDSCIGFGPDNLIATHQRYDPFAHGHEILLAFLAGEQYARRFESVIDRQSSKAKGCHISFLS